MTSASPADATGSHATPPGRHRDRKSTLTCPRCGHASPADGDWTEVLDRRGLTSVHCPVCRHQLTARWRATSVQQTWQGPADEE